MCFNATAYKWLNEVSGGTKRHESREWGSQRGKITQRSYIPLLELAIGKRVVYFILTGRFVCVDIYWEHVKDLGYDTSTQNPGQK